MSCWWDRKGPTSKEKTAEKQWEKENLERETSKFNLTDSKWRVVSHISNFGEVFTSPARNAAPTLGKRPYLPLEMYHLVERCGSISKILDLWHCWKWTCFRDVHGGSGRIFWKSSRCGRKFNNTMAARQRQYFSLRYWENAWIWQNFSVYE